MVERYNQNAGIIRRLLESVSKLMQPWQEFFSLARTSDPRKILVRRNREATINYQQLPAITGNYAPARLFCLAQPASAARKWPVINSLARLGSCFFIASYSF